jgi:hypothetical protein
MSRSPEGRLSIYEREIPTRIFESVCGDDLGERLRHNEQHYLLSIGPNILVYEVRKVTVGWS